MTELFEPVPRYKGAPPICEATNFLAHQSEVAAHAFHERENPRAVMGIPWRCVSCGLWHYRSTAADPAGTTSGTTRRQKHH